MIAGIALGADRSNGALVSSVAFRTSGPSDTLRSDCALWACITGIPFGTDRTDGALAASLAFGANGAGDALWSSFTLWTLGARCARRTGLPRITLGPSGAGFTSVTFGADQAAVRAYPLTIFIDQKLIGDAYRARSDIPVDLLGFAGLQGIGHAAGGDDKARRHFTVAINRQPQFYLIAFQQVIGQGVAVAITQHQAVSAVLNADGHVFGPEDCAKTEGIGVGPSIILVVGRPPG